MSTNFLGEFPVMSGQTSKKRHAETSLQHKPKLPKRSNAEEIDIPALASQKKVILQINLPK